MAEQSTVTIVSDRTRAVMRSKKIREILKKYHDECQILRIKNVYSPMRLFISDMKTSFPSGFNDVYKMFGLEDSSDLMKIMSCNYVFETPLVDRFFKNKIVTNVKLFELVGARVAAAQVDSKQLSLQIVSHQNCYQDRVFYSSSLYREAFEEAMFNIFDHDDRSQLVDLIPYFTMGVITPFVNQHKFGNESLCAAAIEFREYINNFAVHARQGHLCDLYFFNILRGLDLFDYMYRYVLSDVYAEATTCNQVAANSLRTLLNVGLSTLELYVQEDDEGPVFEALTYSQLPVQCEQATTRWLQDTKSLFTSLRSFFEPSYLIHLDETTYALMCKLHNQHVQTYFRWFDFIRLQVESNGRDHFTAEELAMYDRGQKSIAEVSLRQNIRIVDFQDVRLTGWQLFWLNDGALFLPRLVEPMMDLSTKLRRLEAGSKRSRGHDANQAIFDSNLAESSKQKCVICMTNERHYVLNPCGHLVFCEPCLYKFAQSHTGNVVAVTQVNIKMILSRALCPVCRARIDGHLRVVF